MDQSTWGNDFWQADYNTATGDFDLIYNVNQDTPDDLPVTIEYYLGDQAPDFSELLHEYSVNTVTTMEDNSASADLGDALVLTPIISGTTYSGGTWLWTLPDGSTATDPALALDPVALGDAGQYDVLFVDSLGCSLDLAYTVCYSPTEMIPQSNVDNTVWSTNTNITLANGSSVQLAPQVREAGSVSPGGGQWTWQGPNAYQATGRVVSLPSTAVTGTYTYTYTNSCGGAISATFEIQTPNLPIALIDFTARAIDNKLVRLDWRTASELNNKGFDIERSTDARSWKTIDFVAGAGTSLEVNTYTHDDLAPQLDLNYYRLKQMDFDGRFVYSEIQVADISRRDDFIVYPSPTKGGSIYLGFSRAMKGTISLYGLQGRLVHRLVLEEERELFEVGLPKGIGSGLYFVEVVNEGGGMVEKLVVKRRGLTF